MQTKTYLNTSWVTVYLEKEFYIYIVGDNGTKLRMVQEQVGVIGCIAKTIERSKFAADVLSGKVNLLNRNTLTLIDWFKTEEE